MTTFKPIYNTGQSGNLVTGSGTEEVDDAIQHSFSLTNSAHPHKIGSYDKSKQLIVRLRFNVTVIHGSVCRLRIFENNESTGIPTLKVTKNFTSLGPHEVHYFVLSSGMPTAPPTYLEELHKLDRYSNSQYFPKGL